MSHLPLHAYHKNLATDADMSGDIESQSQNLDETVSFCVQFVWTDGTTVEGTALLEVSNDDLNWVAIPASELDVTGDTGTHIINVEKPAYRFVRGVYQRTDGSGTMTIDINGKRG